MTVLLYAVNIIYFKVYKNTSFGHIGIFHLRFTLPFRLTKRYHRYKMKSIYHFHTFSRPNVFRIYAVDLNYFQSRTIGNIIWSYYGTSVGIKIIAI